MRYRLKIAYDIHFRIKSVLRRSIGLEIHKTHYIFDDARMHVINSEKIALLQLCNSECSTSNIYGLPPYSNFEYVPQASSESIWFK